MSSNPSNLKQKPKWPELPKKIEIVPIPLSQWQETLLQKGWTYDVVDLPIGTAILTAFQDKFCSFVMMEEPLLTQISSHVKKDPNHIQKLYKTSHWQVMMIQDEARIPIFNLMLQIPKGETISYKELAQRAGFPKRIRPIASIVGTNTLPYFIPCHRIIRSSGDIGSYIWGSAAKREILKAEGYQGV